MNTMIKEITIAGIKLNNYTVHEMLTHIEKNLSANVFTTVEEIYMKTILMAKEDSVLKEVVETLDITVVAETGILDAANQLTLFRKKEIEAKAFFFQFMKRIERNNMTVFVLGDSEKEVGRACEYIADEFPRLKIAGVKVLDEGAGTEDDVINEINMITPSVILSVLPSPKQEHFLVEHKGKLSAKIWYGLGSRKLNERKYSLETMVLRLLRKHKLMKYVNGHKEEVEQ